MRRLTLCVYCAVLFGILGWIQALPENCDPKSCPRIRCPKKLLFQDDTMCCPVCQCRYKGKSVMPGTFCDLGRRCVCENGKVKCKFECPLNVLNCVDPVMGDDCCFHCENGQTCFPPTNRKLIIKAGEYKAYKQNVCTCLGDPWFPYAFCAPKKLSNSLVKNFGDFLVDYMKM